MKKKDDDKIPKVERQGWNAEKIAEESANEESNDVVRKILRGDETKGDPDKRDIVGAPDFADTPHGREEENKKNENKHH